MPTIKIHIKKANKTLIDVIKTSIEKKKLINKYIKEGKNLKDLNDRGIKFRQPL